MRVLLLATAPLAALAQGYAATRCEAEGVTIAHRSARYIVGRPHQRGAIYGSCENGRLTCFEDSGLADAPQSSHKAVPCDARTINARRRKLGVAINLAEDKWPNGLVFYRFSTQYPLADKEKDMVRQAIKVYEATDLGVAFQECEPMSLCNNKYVDISQKEDACYSYVGYTGEGGGQIMNLGKSCFEEPGTAVHELGHALGLYHEHTHPQREVIVLTDGNLPVSASNYAKETDALLKPYDKASIMHYGRSAGLCLPKDQYPLDSFCDVEVTTNCVMPKKTHCNNSRNDEIGQRKTLSPGDINTLKAIYGTQKPTLKPTSAPGAPTPLPSSSSPSSSPSPSPTNTTPAPSSPSPTTPTPSSPSPTTPAPTMPTPTTPSPSRTPEPPSPTTPAPTTSTPSPSTTTPAPSTSTPQPTTPSPTTPAPTPTVTTPSPTTSTPSPTTTAPAPTTTAPPPTTPAPTPTTTAPSPTSAAPPTTAAVPQTSAPARTPAAPVPSTASPTPTSKEPSPTSAPEPTTTSPSANSSRPTPSNPSTSQSPATSRPSPSTNASPSRTPQPPRTTQPPPAPTTRVPVPVATTEISTNSPDADVPAAAPTRRPTTVPPSHLPAQTSRPAPTLAPAPTFAPAPVAPVPTTRRPVSVAPSPTPTEYKPGNVIPDRNTDAWWKWWETNKWNKKWADYSGSTGNGYWWKTTWSSTSEVSGDADTTKHDDNKGKEGSVFGFGKLTATTQKKATPKPTPKPAPKPKSKPKPAPKPGSFRGWWGR